MKEYATYVAENGEILIALDEVQAAAFENAGLKPVEEPRRGRPKADQQ